MRFVEYPHPVLQPGGSDYQEDAKFDILFEDDKQTIDEENIALSVGYELQCPGLEKTLADGKSEACLVVHSPAASYRRLYPFEQGNTAIEVKVNKFDVIEKIELKCVILAADEMSGFELDDFDPLFFFSASFKLRKGDMLAMTDKVVLHLDDADLEKPVASIFNINKREEQTAQILPDFESDSGKIEINLCKSLYTNYNLIDQAYAKVFRRCLTGAIVLPVLVEAIDKLRDQYDYYTESFRWAYVIDNKLTRQGIDLPNSDESSTRLADVLLGNVIDGSLDAFWSVIDERSEGEDSIGGVD